MSSPSIVRPAIPDDEPEIWRLFRALHEENGMLKMSERKVQWHMDRFLHPELIAKDDQGARGFIGVIGPVGALEGAIMMGFGSPWYSEDVTLDEYLNFVDPAHRNSNHAKSLIAYVKNVVDQVRGSHPGLQLIIGVLSNKRTAAKVRLYERQLTQCGAFFIYPPPADIQPIKHFYRTA